MERMHPAPGEVNPPTLESTATLSWMRLLIDPQAGTVEISAKTSRGFISKAYPPRADFETIAQQASQWDREGAKAVYFALNPRKPDYRRVPRKRAGNAHVACRRLLLIDFDPERPSGTSSTDAEKQRAREKAFACALWLKSQGWPDPVIADSGNGDHLVYRIDLPNDQDVDALIAGVLNALADRFDGDGIQVDRAVKDAARICKFYGTTARKGENAPERPWRQSRVVSLPETFAIVPRSLLEAVAAPALALALASAAPIAKPPTPSAPALAPAPTPQNRRERYAVKGIERELARLDVALNGSRNTTLNEVAFASFQLALGCGLDSNRVRQDLRTAALAIGLGETETDQTLDSALEGARNHPRALPDFNAANGNGNGNARAQRSRGEPPMNGIATPPDPGDAGVNKAPDDPHRLARLYARSREIARFWAGEFYEWSPDDSCYRPVASGDIRGRLTKSTEAEFDRLNRLETEDHAQLCARLPEGEKRPKPPVCRRVTRRLIEDATNALQSETLLEMARCSAIPAWIGPPPSTDWTAANTFVCANGLLNLDTLELRPPSPDYFAIGASPALFNPYAAPPERFFEFLNQLWPDDPESVALLQQWFGLCLTTETRFQKALALIGAKRSGKGTIGRILTDLIGSANVASPKLASFANQFGLAPLIGKPLAIISEMRLTAKLDSGQIVENLLSITGEDAMTIDRKHREAWTGRFPTRIMVMSNELPKLADASAALASRFLYLRLRQSFAGREDLELEGKLRAELDGILLWAVQGWRSLKTQGRFVQPEKSAELAEEMAALSSPAHEFAGECLEIGPGFREVTSVVFERWRKWGEARGIKEADDKTGWTQSVFGRKLRAAAPEVETSTPTTVPGHAGNVRFYLNARLKPETEIEAPFD